MYRKTIRDKDPFNLGCDAAFCTFGGNTLLLSSRVKRQEQNSSRIVQSRILKVVYEFRIVERSDHAINLR